MRRLTAIITALLLLACGRPASSHDRTPVTKALLDAAPGADLVFLGEVREVRRSPGAWSGAGVAHQEVVYRVTRVLAGAGAKPGDELVVAHLLVEGSRTADPGGKVELRRDLFRKGASLVVLADRLGKPPAGGQQRWQCVSQDHGVAAADPALVRDLERRLGEAK